MICGVDGVRLPQIVPARAPSFTRGEGALPGTHHLVELEAALRRLRTHPGQLSPGVGVGSSSSS